MGCGNVFSLDNYMPESVKKVSDKLTPEWAKGAGAAMGLNLDSMGLPQIEEPAPQQSGGSGLSGLLALADKAAGGKISEKRKAIARSRTVFTSPLGLGGIASLAKKYLLGE